MNQLTDPAGPNPNPMMEEILAFCAKVEGEPLIALWMAASWGMSAPLGFALMEVWVRPDLRPEVRVYAAALPRADGVRVPLVSFECPEGVDARRAAEAAVLLSIRNAVHAASARTVEAVADLMVDPDIPEESLQALRAAWRAPGPGAIPFGNQGLALAVDELEALDALGDDVTDTIRRAAETLTETDADDVDDLLAAFDVVTRLERRFGKAFGRMRRAAARERDIYEPRPPKSYPALVQQVEPPPGDPHGSAG